MNVCNKQRYYLRVVEAGNPYQLKRSRRVRNTRPLFKFPARCDRERDVLSPSLFVSTICLDGSIEDTPHSPL